MREYFFLASTSPVTALCVCVCCIVCVWLRNGYTWWASRNIATNGLDTLKSKAIIEGDWTIAYFHYSIYSNAIESAKKLLQYTAKFLFHQSPTRHSHYTETGLWPCSDCWQLQAALWLHCHLQLGHCAAGSFDKSLHSHWLPIVGNWWNRSFAL